MPRLAAAVPPFRRSLAARTSATIALGLLIAASACLDDAPLAPSGGAVRLGIRAQVAPGPGEHAIAIRVYYHRQNETEIDLPVTPAQLVVPRGGTSTRAITVQIAECLADPQRMMSEASTGCRLSVELRLLGSDGSFISEQTQEVEASAPGEEVPVEPFNLPQAAIALSSNSATFLAMENDESLPPASEILISSATGASLGDLSVEVEYPAQEEVDGWLSHSLGEGGLTLRPAHLDLYPGTYTATVRISASRAGVQPVTVAVTLTVTGRPRELVVMSEGPGSATVTSSPAGIECAITFGQSSGACAVEFPFATQVTLAITTTQGEFIGWGGACAGMETCTVTMSEDATVSARFATPRAGGDLVVFSDVNVFDATALQTASNVRMVHNLVGYGGEGPRATKRGVRLECGRGNSQEQLCGSFFDAFDRTLTGIDYGSFSTSSKAGTLTSIDPEVKVIMFLLSCEPFTATEVSVLRQFAADGGRVVFVSENSAAYSAECGLVQDQLASSLGVNMTHRNAQVACGYQTLPAAALRPHQITEGMTEIVIACSSEIVAGALVQPLFYDVTGTRLLAAVGPIDTSPNVEFRATTILRVAPTAAAMRAGPASLIGH